MHLLLSTLMFNGYKRILLLVLFCFCFFYCCFSFFLIIFFWGGGGGVRGNFLQGGYFERLYLVFIMIDGQIILKVKQ